MMRRLSLITAILVAQQLLLSEVTIAQAVKIALPVLSFESLPIFVAQDQDFFKKHLVDIEVIASRGGGEAMKAYISGDVQIVATGFPEVGLMRSKGVDVMLYFAQTSRVPFALLGRSDLGIKSVTDLKGRTIAITSPGSLTANLTRYFISVAGMVPERDVSLISVGGGGEILGALKSKRADAAMVFEPFVSIALKEKFANVVVDVAEELNAFSSSPLATSSAFIGKSPKLAQGIVEALFESQQLIKRDYNGVFEIARRRFPNADPEVLESAFGRMYKVFSADGNFVRDNIKKTQQICIDLGIMPKSYPYEDIVAPVAQE
jgi:NitT/TauT family transport system substrate-binding protein